MVDVPTTRYIRRVTPHDYVQVAAIMCDLGIEASDLEQQIERYVNGRGYHLLVAVDRDRILGFASYAVIFEQTSHHCYGMIHQLGVSLDCQRQGIGGELLAAVKEATLGPQQTYGCRELRIKVDETNLKACRLLRRAGFKATSILRNWYTACTPPRDAYQFTYTAHVGAELTFA